MNAVDQIVNRGSAVFFRNVGKMSIPGCSIWVCVTEKCLDVEKA